MIMGRNYDRFPATRISGRMVKGWESIRKTLSERGQGPLAVDFYTGVYEDEEIHHTQRRDIPEQDVIGHEA